MTDALADGRPLGVVEADVRPPASKKPRTRQVVILALVASLAGLGAFFWLTTEPMPGPVDTADCRVCGCNQACAW